MSVTQIQTSGISDDGVTTAKIDFESALVPLGGIIMWSGTTIPSGWALCNGDNNTPDLRNRFIVGANDVSQAATTTQVGPGFNAINGAINDTYTPGDIGGSVAHQLSLAEMPTHSHDLYASSNTDGGSGTGWRWESNNNTRSATVGGTNIGSTGSGYFHENRPPYYALAFIMRVS